MKYTVKQRQTTFDVAIQKCGSEEAAFEISRLNDISISDTVEPGTELELPAVVNQKIVDYYNANSIEPATEDLDTADEEAMQTIVGETIITINEELPINTLN